MTEECVTIPYSNELATCRTGLAYGGDHHEGNYCYVRDTYH